MDTLRSMSVTGCLFKPFEPEELLESLESLVGNQAMTQDRRFNS